MCLLSLHPMQIAVDQSLRYSKRGCMVCSAMWWVGLCVCATAVDHELHQGPVTCQPLPAVLKLLLLLLLPLLLFDGNAGCTWHAQSDQVATPIRAQPQQQQQQQPARSLPASPQSAAAAAATPGVA
jgi:hypothetical protein